MTSDPPSWHDDPWATPRHHPQRQLVIALTALVLLLGGGVAAWATLARNTDTPALTSPIPTPAPGWPPVELSEPQPYETPSSVDTGTTDPESAALDELTKLVAFDQPETQTQLAEAWVPQLSSKRLGLVADGISYGYADILDDHLGLRATYNARLLWSGDWTSFQEGDFYVTVAAVPFRTPEEANAWCDGQAIGADNCFAKRLSTIAGPEGSTVNR